MSTRSNAFSRMILPVCVAALIGCGSTGAYQWVTEVPASTQAKTGDDDFVMKEGDIVHVRVYKDDSITTDQRVRPDGKVTVPFAGEFMARGKKPAALAREIETRLKGVLVAPNVTVTVEPAAQINVSVLGQVRNAGAFMLDVDANVLQALASAGGLNDYAREDYIFVLRRSLDKRVRFRYADLKNGDKSSIGFGLQTGDVVVVE